MMYFLNFHTNLAVLPLFAPEIFKQSPDFLVGRAFSHFSLTHAKNMV